MIRESLIFAALGMAAAGCSAGSSGDDFGPTGEPSDGGLDVSLVPDMGPGPDVVLDVNMDSPSNACPGVVQSFIWISNTGEGTLSKVCTLNGVEVARYYTSPQEVSGDPSRTSVNLHGDAVVTNRSPTPGPSSVTKFAAEIKECIDRNNNGQIDTSYGPTDVKPWGEDECMLWNTPLTGGTGEIGARATAWDGLESSKTGLGGHVYIGALMNKNIYKLDGDTGEILAHAPTALQHYGGAIDGKGNFWTVSMGCTIGMCQIERINVDDFTDHEVFPVHCGYGISIDSKGRVWTAGLGCVSRFDPATKENKWVTTGGQDFNRGVAVGAELSAGFIWAASTNGELIQVDPEALTVVNRQSVGGSDMVGVAIDYEGYVWTVSQSAGSAYKVNPNTWEVLPAPIGNKPYTYSDMTGMQLRGVKPNPR
ncbi:MAG: hypothetical protein HY898_02635 [Deltaproteobacteria bacterium]|nr:hypothetical protein [Deltaproteobacteria bacterium]